VISSGMILMKNFVFKPTFGASILTLIGVVLLLGLGTWQVQRLVWKNEILNKIHERMTDDIMIFPSQILDVDQFDYAKGAVRGEFLYDKEFFVVSRHYNGERGVHALTPFRRLSGDLILVNRGFVREEDIPFMRRPKGVIILNGILHLPDDRNRFTPKNTSGSNMIYASDVDFIARETGFEFSSPMVLYASDVKSGVPVGGQIRLDIANDHLEYAFFWYVMALMMIVFYFSFFLKRAEDDVD